MLVSPGSSWQVELLEQCPNKHGYLQSRLTPGFWKHLSQPIQFTIYFNSFDINYIGYEQALHLQCVPKEHYKVTTD